MPSIKRKPLPKRTVKAPAKKVLEAVTEDRVAEVPVLKTEYVHRDVFGVRDFDLLDAAFDAGQNVLLFGPTGPGKTMVARAWAAERGMPAYRIPSNAGIEPNHMFGKYIPDEEEGGFVWVDGPVTDIMRNGGLIIIDEINFTPERIAPVLFPALDDDRSVALMEHKNEVIRAHRPNCWCPFDCRSRWVMFIATMNDGRGYAGTRPLNAALRNRFEIQIDWGYDKEVEAKLVQLPSLLNLANNQRTMDRRVTPISTNMLAEFQHIALQFGATDTARGYRFAVGNFVAHFTAEERGSIQVALDGAKDEIIAELNALLTDGDIDALVADPDPVPTPRGTASAPPAFDPNDPFAGFAMPDRR